MNSNSRTNKTFATLAAICSVMCLCSFAANALVDVKVGEEFVSADDGSVYLFQTNYQAQPTEPAWRVKAREELKKAHVDLSKYYCLPGVDHRYLCSDKYYGNTGTFYVDTETGVKTWLWHK
jgi:hypothetical protein